MTTTPAPIPRNWVRDALLVLGLDPQDIVSIQATPTYLIVERLVRDTDGHCVVDSDFTVRRRRALHILT